MSATRIADLGLEQVWQPSVAQWYQNSASLAGTFRKQGARVQKSRWGFRYTAQKYPGGAFAKADLDGGALQYTGQGDFTKLKCGYFNYAFGFHYTWEQIQLAESNIQAIRDFVGKVAADAATLLETHMNIMFFNDGSGRLASGLSSFSGTRINFAGATDNFGVHRLPAGSVVDFWSSDGLTKRAGGPYTIVTQSPTGKFIDTHVAVTGLANGDIPTIAGLDAYGTTTSTTGNAGYPGTFPFTGAGIGSDSCNHGLDYILEHTPSSYFYGVQRSAYPVGLVPSVYDALDSPLTYNMIGELRARASLQLGYNRTALKWKGLMSPGHRSSLQAATQRIQRVDVQASSGKSQLFDDVPDVDYNNDAVIMMDGVPMSTSSFMHRRKVMCFDPADFAMVGSDPEFFRQQNAGPLLIRRNSSGFATTYFDTFMTVSCEYFNPVPGQAGVVVNVLPQSFA